MNIHILQHSLGLNEFGQGESYRNHFVTDPKGKDFEDCQALAKNKLMIDHGPKGIYGDMHVFSVTNKGKAYVKKNSEKPPKISKSKMRYRLYLLSETGESFIDWLRNSYWDDYRIRNGA